MMRRLALMAVAALLASCVTHLDSPVVLSSFKLVIVSPADSKLGTLEQPMDVSIVDFKLAATAIGTDGKPYDFTGPVQIRLSFGGNLTPTRTSPLPRGWPTMHLSHGQGTANVTLPPSFGQLTFWVEDGPACVCGAQEYAAKKHDGQGNVVFDKPETAGQCKGQCQLGSTCFACGTIANACLQECPDILDAHTYATGASRTLYRPLPAIADIQTTADPQHTPLEGKHVLVKSATGGGKLVVVAVKPDGFAVQDTGLPPGSFNAVYIYSYSYPKTNPPGSAPGSPPIPMLAGMTVKNINGSVGTFNGFTELNFPLWEIESADPLPTRIPAPTPITRAMLKKPLVMKALEAQLVELDDFVVCDLTKPAAAMYDLPGFHQYNQWRLTPPGAIDAATGYCSELADPATGDTSVGAFSVSYATVPCFDPAKNFGKTVPKLVGMLRHVEPAAGIEDWVVEPRNAADLPMGGDLLFQCHN